MSAFNRLPFEYRQTCAKYASRMGPLQPNGMPKRISSQNRRVRFAVDMSIAKAKEFPNRVTRQQQRAARR